MWGREQQRLQLKRTRPNPYIKELWIHKYCLLDSVEAESTPITVELVELANAGLGTEKLCFLQKMETMIC